MTLKRPWQVQIHFSAEIGMLTFRPVSHTHPAISFSKEAVEYCGGAMEKDEDGYVVSCVYEPAIVDVAREIAGIQT